MLTVELCTLSFRLDDERKAMFVSSALFGDGAAAQTVSRRSSRLPEWPVTRAEVVGEDGSYGFDE